MFRLSSAWWPAGLGELGAGEAACGVSLAPHKLGEMQTFPPLLVFWVFLDVGIGCVYTKRKYMLSGTTG